MASVFSRIASFARRDYRYVLLGTSAIAAIGMMLSSQPRSPMSFLANAFTVELVMYYLLAAWIVMWTIAFAALGLLQHSHRLRDGGVPFVHADLLPVLLLL